MPAELGLVVIKGGGDQGSGVAHRLHRAGFGVVITELAQPLVVRRAVAFAAAVGEGAIVVEGIRALRVRDSIEARQAVERDEVGVLVDPCARAINELWPLAVVDAIMAKQNLGTTIRDAPIVVALGPGFRAGLDCHAVVETNRGHNLGRVYYSGHAEANTGEPARVRGSTHARVLRAPVSGLFMSTLDIGQRVETNGVVGMVGDMPVVANIAGVIRGLIASGTSVDAGVKIGDIDPSGDVERCFTISDKSRAIGGGALEAILHLKRSG